MTGNNSLTVCGDEICRLLTLALNEHVLREPTKVANVGFNNIEYTFELELKPLSIVDDQ